MRFLGFIDNPIAHYIPNSKSKRKRKFLRRELKNWAMGLAFDTWRYSAIVLGAANAAALILGGCLTIVGFRSCGHYGTFPFATVMVAAFARIVAMINIGIAQEASAKTILESQEVSVDTAIYTERRIKYIKWIWWSRFAMVISLLQGLGAAYLLIYMSRSAYRDDPDSNCLLGVVSKDSKLEQNVLAVFVLMICFTAIFQCFAGSDVLRWRSFYATEDSAWKAHYREVFDVGIREALCCLGRVKYLSAAGEDEVYSVARVLGELVAYRASGTGHLELLTGLALFQRCANTQNSDESLVEAPRGRIEEAASLHRFAEAAYTGPLLDVGRNPFLFPCTWLHRQGVLSPWSRNRRPKLKGDNWWRGNAAAFLKYLDLPPEALRQGRVCQGRCEAAYFVVALHHQRTVVITIRGTETPEDLITDGLCKECPLVAEDLEGLIKSKRILVGAEQDIESTFPHYGHSGIVETARDLFLQIEGSPVDECQCSDIESGGSRGRGFLSSLLGRGGECEGYSVRIVGHSLGGAIASLLGLRLYNRYPDLHVYAYGSLPCVDLVVADACSDFITSIIYDNEFSARLSVGSVLRLRAASLMALSQDQTTDTTLIFRLARQFLFLNKYQANRIQTRDPTHGTPTEGEFRQYSNNNQADVMDQHKDLLSNDTGNRSGVKNEKEEEDSMRRQLKSEVVSFDDPVSRFMESVPDAEHASIFDPPELFLPGLIIHIVPDKNNFAPIPLWKTWKLQHTPDTFKVYVANKHSFKDLVVSPSMFLDHLPWRCRNALHKILANQNK